MLKVRRLKKEEKTKMYEILERRDVPSAYKKRVKIILLSDEGYCATDICPMVNIHPKTVRKWIKRFNEKGLDGLLDKPRGGAPRIFTDKQRKEIIKIALSHPKDLGLPFTNWSLSKLRDYLIKKKILKSISIEMLRIILNSEGIKFKRMRTYLRSRDPEYELKKTKY